MQKHTEKASKRNKDLAALQLQLWNSGAFKGVIDKRTGKQVTYERAVDGLMGRMTRQAMENNKKQRESIQITSSYQQPKISKQKNTKKNGLANMYEMTHAAQTGGMSKQPIITNNSQETNQSNGHAIYLHYPNFIGNSKNAFKIGNFDPGEVIGNPQLPVGHAATILIDDKGNANYYEYGRYANQSNIIGKEQRPNEKGGNWRQFKLPRQNNDENDSVYVARIQKMLPDTKTGAYQAMTIPEVDVRKAQEYIRKQADDPNRNEYGIFNTCATGACNATLPFRATKLNNKQNKNNREGYSEQALNWSRLPFTTDSYAQKARTAASKVYIMNNK